MQGDNINENLAFLPFTWARLWIIVAFTSTVCFVCLWFVYPHSWSLSRLSLSCLAGFVLGLVCAVALSWKRLLADCTHWHFSDMKSAVVMACVWCLATVHLIGEVKTFICVEQLWSDLRSMCDDECIAIAIELGGNTTVIDDASVIDSTCRALRDDRRCYPSHERVILDFRIKFIMNSGPSMECNASVLERRKSDLLLDRGDGSAIIIVDGTSLLRIRGV